MSNVENPPNTGGGKKTYSNTGGGAMNPYLKAFIQLWISFWVICFVFAICSAPFLIGVTPLKTFVVFGLCGLSLYGLYDNIANDSNRTWLDHVKHWGFLALIAHTAYFNVFHDMVVK